MYLNDARRADFYAALGLNWREYDQSVIRLTNDISTQVYPVTLPVDHPSFFRNLDACVHHDADARRLEARGDTLSKARAAQHKAAIGLRLFANYRLPARQTTEANRWRGLAGFPNYPGSDWRVQAVGAV